MWTFAVVLSAPSCRRRIGRGPQALRDFVSAEIDKWTLVIKAAGAGLN